MEIAYATNAMKANTPELMKFKRLQRKLSESRRGTVGLLESMWIEVSRNCPEGDIGRFSNEEIAIMVDWDGDPDLLVESLVDCKWLDKCSTHRLVVHDWSDHCPTYIKGGLSKRGKVIAIATSHEVQAIASVVEASATSPELPSTYSIQAKPIQANSSKMASQAESTPSRHLICDDFRKLWDTWKNKLAVNNGTMMDSFTEQAQLYELECFETPEAIEIVRFSVSRTKCNNLITNGDHKPRAKPPPRRNGSELSPEELAAEEKRRYHEMMAKAAK